MPEITNPRIRWEDNDLGGLVGFVGTVEPFMFQIWRESSPSRLVLSSGLPGQFTNVSVDEAPEPLQAEAESWLADFLAAIGAQWIPADTTVDC
jgi:hypothetical protein